MRLPAKATTSWTLAAVGALLFCCHCYILWNLARTFAAGAMPWALVPMWAGIPVTLTGLVVAVASPTQLWASLANLVVLLAYAVIWAPILIG